ncbi:MAG: CDF family Co(II)/Ni(II) efflux transporter DmeF [Bdellovibrio sp.]
MRHEHDYILKDEKISSNEKRTYFVVALTLVTMIVEITYGYLTSSMALLADGWHMASHVGALSISLIVYRLSRSPKLGGQFSFGTGKLIPLGGYTSALMLGVVAVIMAVESVERIINPREIIFETAIGVSVVGLIVNILSALLLWNKHDDHHHDHHHDEHVHDHNHESAFVHVIADALTSVLAILALVFGKYFGWTMADPLMGIVGSIVILKWAYNLCKSTLWELLDGNSKSISVAHLKQFIENEGAGEVLDLHVWRIAPNAHACELIIRSSDKKGSQFYRELILKKFVIDHMVIEEI